MELIVLSTRPLDGRVVCVYCLLFDKVAGFRRDQETGREVAIKVIDLEEA